MIERRSTDDLKTVAKTVVIFVPVIGATLWFPAHPYLGLSLGLCIGTFLSSLIPPKSTFLSFGISILIAAGCGPLYFLLHRSFVR
ncbi:hypothetical protein HDF17_002424 [Granulicella arctica]|uniref:Uncharacterized protein n=1 Tax=Granulicella arctica TaxID=940613 RepID=A0A7Y9PHP6_9BACT|nr:hypothetical protein [Granulicella arctica]